MMTLDNADTKRGKKRTKFTGHLVMLIVTWVDFFTEITGYSTQWKDRKLLETTLNFYPPYVN